MLIPRDMKTSLITYLIIHLSVKQYRKFSLATTTLQACKYEISATSKNKALV